MFKQINVGMREQMIDTESLRDVFSCKMYSIQYTYLVPSRLI